MKINELIKEVTQEYIPVKKAVVEAQKSGKGLSEAEEQKYFELNTTLELYKILKGAFMEEITKNKEVFPVMLAEKLITTRQEDAEKDGKTIKVTVVNESMDYQIDNLPDIPFPAGIGSAAEYLECLVNIGVKYRYQTPSLKVQMRVKQELDAILSNHLEKYFIP